MTGKYHSDTKMQAQSAFFSEYSTKRSFFSVLCQQTTALLPLADTGKLLAYQHIHNTQCAETRTDRNA